MGRGKRRAATRVAPLAQSSLPARRLAASGAVFVGEVDEEARALCAAIRATLAASPDLLKPDWRRRNALGHPMTGHCYVASEALHRLLGGDEAGWHSFVMNFRDDVDWEPGELTHRWLEHEDGRRIDPTADQFRTPVPYERGKRAAFMTNRHLAGKPSTRTQSLLSRLASA